MLQTINVLKAMVRKNFLIMIRYPLNFVCDFLTFFSYFFIFYYTGKAYSPDLGESLTMGGNTASLGNIIIYGSIIMLFLSRSSWTMGIYIRTEQYQGTFESLYHSPSPRYLHLISRLVDPLCWGILTSAIIITVINLFFTPLPLNNILLSLYTFVFTLMGIFGLSFVFAALALLLKDTVYPIIYFFDFAVIILCALIFPFASLPVYLKGISRLIPLSYCVDLFRSSLMGFPKGYPELASVNFEILMVAIWGVGMQLIGYLFFRHCENRIRINGSLSMY